MQTPFGKCKWRYPGNATITKHSPLKTPKMERWGTKKDNTNTTYKTIDAIKKTRLFKYIENFTSKNWKFSDKNSEIFRIPTQNIDCVYSLEPPQWGGSNEYPQSMFLSKTQQNDVYPLKPQVYII